MLGAFLDDVVVGLPAEAVARVPSLAAQAFARVGCQVEQQKTQVWVPAGLCQAGCEAWWSPRGLRFLGAPVEGETPLAALGELGAAVGDPGFVSDLLDQAFEGYQAFVAKVVAATVEADTSWSRVQAGVGLLRLCAPSAPPPFPGPAPGGHRKARGKGRRGHAGRVPEAPLGKPDHAPPTNPSGSADSPGGVRNGALPGVACSGLAGVLARNVPGGSGSRRERLGFLRSLHLRVGELGGRAPGGGRGASCGGRTPGPGRPGVWGGPGTALELGRRRPGSGPAAAPPLAAAR